MLKSQFDKERGRSETDKTGEKVPRQLARCAVRYQEVVVCVWPKVKVHSTRTRPED